MNCNRFGICWPVEVLFPVHGCMKMYAHLRDWAFLHVVVLLLIFSLCSPAAASYGIKRQYGQARSRLEKLLTNPEKQNDRHPWLECLKDFRSVYTAQPDGPMADDALFMMGHLYSELYQVSSSAQDRQEAVDYFRRLLRRFPNTPYCPLAKEGIAKLFTAQQDSVAEGVSEEGSIAADKGAAGDEPILIATKKASKKYDAKGQPGLLAEVRSLRFWSNPSYTRVVIDVDKEVPFSYRLLRKDPSTGKPQRLYVDVNKARMGAGLKPVVPIGDDLLKDARAAQYAPGTVRVVLDIKSIDKFKIFSLRNPFRIVLDVNGIRIAKKTSSKKRVRPRARKPGTAKIPKGALAKQLALGVKRIVIDPGHGGRDPGGAGYYKGVQEKNVTLELARRLAKKIRQNLGCEAILTRDKDVFLSLEERTAIANTKNADIFVSIHTNASRNKYSRGIETYFLNLATDNQAIMVAARENATSAKNISDLETILNDLMKNAKVNESSRLAGSVQRALARKLRPKYKRIKDLGVKQAPFYVLLGAEMPCILVEVGFISNPRECRWLNTASFQEDVADAIVTGIKGYIKEISPATLTRADEPIGIDAQM